MLYIKCAFVSVVLCLSFFHGANGAEFSKTELENEFAKREIFGNPAKLTELDAWLENNRDIINKPFPSVYPVLQSKLPIEIAALGANILGLSHILKVGAIIPQGLKGEIETHILMLTAFGAKKPYFEKLNEGVVENLRDILKIFDEEFPQS
ncbi:MAG: hypothetical protein NTX76_03710 [Alphaproteobacteria bacterium]|nr:hypothetical protein [Alphaproteobacteria bacterium]